MKHPVYSLSPCLLAGACAFLAFFAPGRLQAQWVEQSITLRPGWNAVYLEVQPEPAECDAVFAGRSVESVWRYNRKQAMVQFIDDPNELVLAQPDWLKWVPPNHSLAGGGDLHLLEGARPYVIKVADHAPAFTWTVRGKPKLRAIEWLRDSLNFIGVPLPSANAPTFRTFCSGSGSRTNFYLAEANIYRLQANGTWARVTAPATTPMQPGEAFWIRAVGLPDYSGPLELATERRGGVEFGRILTEQPLRIRNISTNPTVVTVSPLPSTNPPSGSATALAGPVPLGYWQNDFASNRAGWTNLPAQLQSQLPPGGVWELRLEVRRRDMAAFTPPAGATDALYQSVLEITDSANRSRRLVPVTANGLVDLATPAGSLGGGTGNLAPPPPPPDPRAGLWVGTARIDKVNQPSAANSLEPVSTASELQFRLIVHVNAAGQARLLQQVLQAWKPGTYKSAGDDTTNRVVDQPGQFVLLTDDRLLSQYTGAAVRDGQAVVRRFSTAAFAFRDPILMPLKTGAGFGQDGSIFTCAVLLPYNDARNPFVHRYHPDHNNRDDRQQPLTLHTNLTDTNLVFTTESWTVRRDLSLTFTGADPEGLSQSLSGWGDNQLGGFYQETITGLHKQPLILRGTFQLFQASRVGALN